VANADGEAERFGQLAGAYAQAPEATRSRLYIDTMETILSRSRKIVIDAKSGSGNMLYLPIDKLAEAVRAATPSAPPANAAPAAATGAPAAPGPAAGAGAAPGASGSDRSDQSERGRERGER
jgi:membrane protease subunit HflK